MKRKNPFENFSLPGMSIIPGKENTGNMPPLTCSHDNYDDDYDMSDDELRMLIDEFITTKEDWAATHPEGMKCRSDEYFANLVNMISIAMATLKLPSSTPHGFEKEVAMSCAAYLEDLVSGLGVWHSFRTLHRKKYGKWLPFYDTEHEDYLLDDINIEDLKFLVWQAFCRCGQPESMIYSPYSQGVEIISNLIFDILIDSFEKAPEASRVSDYIRRVFKKGNYFELRNLAEWLVMRNKLISCPNMMRAVINEGKSLASSHDLFDESMGVYFVRSIRAWAPNTGPMGCRSSKYLAEISRAQGFENISTLLDNIQMVNVDVFRMKEVKQKDIVLEDVSGDEYVVTKESFKTGTRFKDTKGYMTSLVKYGDRWWQNGAASVFTEDPFSKDKPFTSYNQNSKSKEWTNSVAERNGGKRIFYCKNKEEVAAILGVPDKTKPNDNVSADNYVLMLSECEGMALLQNLAECFKDKDNPFYKKRIAKEDSLGVIADGNVPEDIAHIIAENKLLPDAEMSAQQGKRFGKAIVQDNMEYLFDFFRTQNPEV